MKILMMMRDNAFTLRGGDTVVLERLKEELTALGHLVEVDLTGQANLSSFEIVHLFNFTTPEKTQALAKLCALAKAKFVVTTLYEDWPAFFNQMIIQELLLSGYIRSGQPIKNWSSFNGTALNANPSEKQDNTFSALAAQLLVSSGFQESVVLRRDYPESGPIEICHFGHQISPFSDSGKMFRDEYKIDNFVLCVGRLEQRKNQLSLLKALEESDITIVFGGGGLNHEQSYANNCKQFRRRGKTVFLDRISSEMLASCYEAASLHVLPSWYELPGLVSIEAAARGTPCVVTDNGTIRDYLGDAAFYCSPGDTFDIENTVKTALSIRKDKAPKADLSKFTWANSALRMLEIYDKAISLPLNEIDIELSKPQSAGSKEETISSLRKLLDSSPSLAQILQERVKK